MSNPVSLYRGAFYQKCAPSNADSTTPPIFNGIVTAIPNNDGSIGMTWGAVTTAKTPADVHAYVALGSVNAATLFQDSNITAHFPADKFQGKIFLMPDEITYFVKGLQYTVGLRSNDAKGYGDTNTAIIVVTAVASGNLAALYQTLLDDLQAVELDLQGDHVDFQADHTNFQADHTDLVAVKDDLVAVELDISQDHIDLVAVKDDLVSVESDLSTDVTDLENVILGLGAISSSLAAGAGQQMSVHTNETTMTIDTDGVV